MSRMNNMSDWLKNYKAKAAENFEKQGFPTNKHEDWRYISLRHLIAHNWKQSEAKLKINVKNNKNIIVTDFVNALENHAEEMQQYFSLFLNTSHQDAFYDFNTALFHQGYVIIVPENVVVDEPIEITYPKLSEEERACWRNLIVLKKQANVSVIEIFENDDSEKNTFHQAITEAFVDSHGKLNHYKKQCESEKNFHISELFVKQQDHTHVESHVLSLSGGFIRSDTHIRLEAPHAHCVLNGVTLGQKKQTIDHHTTVEHLVPQGTSDEYYKTILKDEAQGVFNGKIIVSPQAAQTDSKQNNKTLLLSRGAQMNSKPQLEIFSDDVKCTHGSTIGQLDEDALFYLETRGISKELGQQLLMQAFLSDVLDRVSNEVLKKDVQQFLEKSL